MPHLIVELDVKEVVQTTVSNMEGISKGFSLIGEIRRMLSRLIS